jgi:hypothetical protein
MATKQTWITRSIISEKMEEMLIMKIGELEGIQQQTHLDTSAEIRPNQIEEKKSLWREILEQDQGNTHRKGKGWTAVTVILEPIIDKDVNHCTVLILQEVVVMTGGS